MPSRHGERSIARVKARFQETGHVTKERTREESANEESPAIVGE